MILYGAAIFLGAFLLFLVQPIVAKQILPWFGGSAAVWATCMVFFQGGLLAGYAYADLTSRRLAPRRQAVLHVALLVLSLLMLPVSPGAGWKPHGDENPSWRILGLLAATVGLPYVLLSTTSPLLQLWCARRFENALPYRLFALSNLASLAALLAYPVLIEPWTSTGAQALTWSVCYAVFVALCSYAALSSSRGGAPRAEEREREQAPLPGAGERLVWLLLPAMGSFLLLAVTNHICQNIASVPFLWVLPLGLYLASFILCFDHPRWYRRRLFFWATALALSLMAWYSASLDLKVVIPLYLVGLFAACMYCHGELALRKPAPRHLTTYYLMLSLGGAIGGLLVGVAAPYVLPGYFELAIGLVACCLLLLWASVHTGRWTTVGAAAALVATVWTSGQAIVDQVSGSRIILRNFYGVVRTRDDQGPVMFRALLHGGIIHGGQVLDPATRFSAVSYFSPTSGYGRALASLRDGPRKVGVIGLGAGSILGLARPGDTFRFYEINPQVLDLARREFTFLSESPATVEVVLGDGRLSLERETDQGFDLLAMDAFSGDSIPMHLLTRQAMAVYMRHLKRGGVLAFQATNRFIDIAPVVASLAREYRLTAVLVSDTPEEGGGEEGGKGEDGAINYWRWHTDQIIVTSNQNLLDSEHLRDVAQVLAPRPNFRVWTDDYNNLFRVLK